MEESENIKLAGLAKEYDEGSGPILGYRRVTGWVSHFNHTSCSKNRVHRIMRKLGIHSAVRKKKKKHPPYKPGTVSENKLKRDFNAAKPNGKWPTDATEFKIPGTEKKLYLSAIFDLYGRFPAAYAVSGRNDKRLAFDACGRALRENPDEKPPRSAIDGYMKFYAEERPQERFPCKTPPEVRREALSAENPVQYPVAENRRINAYKAKWCA